MEAQMQSPHDHAYEEGPQNVGFYSVVEGKDEQHHDGKKSVLKKVKAKAKKLKDTIKKHGHDHEHDYHGHGHEYHHDDHEYEDEEEDDDDDGMEKDPEVHGAPMYDSTAVKDAIPGKDFSVEKRMPNLEKPSAAGEDRYDHSIITEVPIRPFGNWDEENSEEGRVRDQILGRQMGMHTADPSRNVGQPRKKIALGEQTGLEEDPHAPKDHFGAIPPPNYQSKVADPTGDGGEEANVDPLIESLDKMKVGDEAEEERGQKVYTGSHDQFAPESHPTKFTTSQENTDEVPKRYNPDRPQDLPRDTLVIKSPEGRGYVEKISSATSAIADKAVSAKNVVASKLGYGGIEEAKTLGRESGVGAGKSASSTTTEYAHKIAATVTQKLAPVYEKVADAGSSVVSKVQGTAKGQEGSEKVPDKGVSVKEYLAKKFRPSEEDKALSEVITDAFHKRKAKPKQGEEAKPMGKVTESEEVKRRLDTGNEEQNEGAGSAVSNTMSAAGKGVVDRVKVAVAPGLAKGVTYHILLKG